jgi:hypothetical protein
MGSMPFHFLKPPFSRSELLRDEVVMPDACKVCAGPGVRRSLLGHQVVLNRGSQLGEPALCLDRFEDPVEAEGRHHVLEHSAHAQGVVAVRRVQYENAGAVEGSDVGRHTLRADVGPMAVEEAEAADRRGVGAEAGVAAGGRLHPGPRGAIPSNQALSGIPDEAIRQEDVQLTIVPDATHREGVSPMCARIDNDQRLVVKDGSQRADPSSSLGPVSDRSSMFTQLGFDVAGNGPAKSCVRHDGDQSFEPMLHVEPGHSDPGHGVLVDAPAPPGQSGQRPHQLLGAGAHRFGQRSAASCFAPELRHYLVEHHGFRGALRQHVDESHRGRTPLDAGARQNRRHGEVPTQTRQQGRERFHRGRQALGASCPSSIRKPLHRGSVGRSGAGPHLRDEFIDQALYLRGHEGTLSAVIVGPEPSFRPAEWQRGEAGQTSTVTSMADINVGSRQHSSTATYDRHSELYNHLA